MKNIITIFSFLLLCNLTNAQNPIACYPFSGDAQDSSAYGNNGIVVGATLTTGQAGIPNTAYYFDGINDYIYVPHSPSIDTPSVITMCAVIKPMGYYTGTCQGNVIFFKGPDRTPGHYGMDFCDNNCDGGNCNVLDTSIEDFRMEVGTIWDYTTPCYSPNIVSNTWYCIICTYDGDSLRFYIDGLFKYSSAVTAFGTNDSGLYMGWNPFPPNAGTFNYWYHGIIDDLRIYNGVLSPQQLKNYCDMVAGTSEIHNPDNSFSIFPNPSHNQFTIQFNSTYLSQNTDITIVNMLGEKVYSESIIHQQTKIIDHHFASGVYFVQLRNNDAVSTKKMVIE